jgi:hypothetical protein
MGSFSKPLAIRDADADDVLQVSKLGSLVFSRTFGHSLEPHQLQAYLEESYSVKATAADLANSSKTMVVATDRANGELVGFALLTRGTTELRIDDGLEFDQEQRISQ